MVIQDLDDLEYSHDLGKPQLQPEDDLPPEIRARLQRPNHQGALLGDSLASCMISLAEEKLKVGREFVGVRRCQKGQQILVIRFFQFSDRA